MESNSFLIGALTSTVQTEVQNFCKSLAAILGAFIGIWHLGRICSHSAWFDLAWSSGQRQLDSGQERYGYGWDGLNTHGGAWQWADMKIDGRYNL